MQLQSLYLSKNQLTELPDWFGQLNRLNSLDISYNKLSKLPGSFDGLGQLQILDLSGNNLSVFPKELIQLQQLQKLGIGSEKMGFPDWALSDDSEKNRLTILPESIVALKHLPVRFPVCSVDKSVNLFGYHDSSLSGVRHAILFRNSVFAL